jgi:CYTH domain-containing protein
MAVEIERKFLVNHELWDKLEKPEPNFLKQGYLSTDPEKTLRVRTTNDKGFITIKGKLKE